VGRRALSWARHWRLGRPDSRKRADFDDLQQAHLVYCTMGEQALVASTSAKRSGSKQTLRDGGPDQGPVWTPARACQGAARSAATPWRVSSSRLSGHP